MPDIKWEEPPADRRRSARTNHDALVQALKENPGKWALVLDRTDHSVATAIRQGRYKSFRPSEHFEVRATSVGDGSRKVKLYARFVGDPS